MPHKITIANKSIIKSIPENGFYVGRGQNSALGNPFPVKASNLIGGKIYTIEESLAKYKLWLWGKVANGDRAVTNQLRVIRERLKTSDVVLVCWCVNKNGEGQCHAQIIRDCVLWMESLEK